MSKPSPKNKLLDCEWRATSLVSFFSYHFNKILTKNSQGFKGGRFWFAFTAQRVRYSFRRQTMTKLTSIYGTVNYGSPWDKNNCYLSVEKGLKLSGMTGIVNPNGHVRLAPKVPEKKQTRTAALWVMDRDLIFGIEDVSAKTTTMLRWHLKAGALMSQVCRVKPM